MTTSPTLPNPSHSPSEMAFAAHSGPPILARSQSFPASFAAATGGRPGVSRDSPVHTIPAGLQDTAWGSPSSLGGLLATVFICHEALQPAQTRALFTAGINETSTAFIMQKFVVKLEISSQKETSVKEYLSLFRLTGPNNVSLFKADGEPSEVNSKLLLYYTPQVIIFPVTNLIHTLSHTTYSWSRRLSRPPLSPLTFNRAPKSGVPTLFCVGIYFSNEKLTEIYQVKNKLMIKSILNK